MYFYYFFVFICLFLYLKKSNLYHRMYISLIGVIKKLAAFAGTKRQKPALKSAPPQKKS